VIAIQGRTQNPLSSGTRSALICVLAVALVLAMLVFVRKEIHRYRFNSTVWINQPDLDGRDTRRSHMVGDLIQNHLRRGMPRQQVRQLLGKPDSTSQYDRENHRDVYGLGHIGHFGIDPSILVLQYDASGRL
jgi:outer membrane protein assembly factor BamE (lipoprotein component of BamABCDE complex)